MPNKWADFDYFDKKFVEKFFCDRLHTKAFETYFYDAIGVETYTETKSFNMDCTLLPFANDKIRILEKVPFADDYIADFENDSKSRIGRLKSNMSKEALRTLDLTLSTDYRFKI